MKKNYQININPKELSSQEITRHKNFDAILEKFHKQPPPKKSPFIYRRLVYLSAIAAAVAGLLFYFGTGPNYLEKSQNHFANAPFINPPFENVKPQFASYQMNANKGGTFEYKSGSKLVVPPAAFVDEGGKVIEGLVDIQYREMHDYVDFFMSGIPMTYDSAGVVYTLESAGMVEIYVEKDGKRVKMAADKNIDVELVSNINVPPGLNIPPNYNIYRLDEDKRNWIYQDLDKMQLVEDENIHTEEELSPKDPLFEIKKKLKDKISAIEVNEVNSLATIESTIPLPSEPIRPQKNNGSPAIFNFDISALEEDISKEYADAKREVTAMNQEFFNMFWQISPQSNVQPEEIQAPEDGTWDGMRLRKLNNRDFTLTLIEGTKALEIIINPVFSGNDFDLALEKFNQEFSEFQTQMEAREEKLAEQKEALANEIAIAKAAAQEEYDNELNAFLEKNQDYAATQHVIKRKVINRFQASNLGVWNCDRPIPPNIALVTASFTDQHQNKYENKTAFLVDKSRNTVLQFLATDNAELVFNKNSENLLWVVDGNKIAVYRPEHFEGLSDIEQKGNHTFVLDLVDREIKSEQDAREVLYF